MRFDIAVGGDELADLLSFAAGEFLPVEQPGDVGCGVAGCYTLQAERRTGAQSLLAKAMADLRGFDWKLYKVSL